MKSDHFTHTADDGVELFVYRWKPDYEIGKGVVQIAHGLAEHAGRYERLAEALTDQGYQVYAGDLRGHGRTARDQRDLGYFGDRDGWNRVVQDLMEIATAAKSASPGIPITLFGHSMGTLMAQQAIYQYPDLYDAVALSGANGKVGFLVQLGRIIARIERLRLGRHGRSDIINGMSFGTFNKAYAPNRTAFDWLSRDESEVDKYIADPNCGFVATTQLWVDMLDAIPRVVRRENWSRIRHDLPIYLFSGRNDQVNDNGLGCEFLAESYREFGLKNISYRVYPGARHETLNELNLDEVTEHIVEWLECLRAVKRMKNGELRMQN